jgi:glycosyltransferase involved in cell wall biosynthesis
MNATGAAGGAADRAALRICHIISGDVWGGAEKASLELFLEMARRGVSLTVVLFNDGILYRRLLQAGVDARLVSERSHSFPAIVRRLMGSGTFEVLHTHRYKEHLVGFLARRSLGVKAHFATLHAWPFLRGRYDLRTKVWTYLTHRFLCPWTVAVSRDIEERLLRFLSEHRVIRIPNALHIPEHDLVQEPTGEGVVIGAVGRMVPVKGFALLLQALDRLEPDVVARIRAVLFFGEGPELDALRGEATGNRWADKIAFRGFVEDGEAIYRQIDILAITSHHEGMPMVLLEAMAHRKLVVASRVGGIPEVVQDGMNGLLFEGGNVESLASRLREAVLRWPELRAVREEGKATVLARASVAKQVEAIMDVYRRTAMARDPLG